MSDSVKRLQLLIEAKGSTAGLVGLKREMGGMFDAQKTAALKAKMHWQEAETAASRAAKAQVRAVESVTKAEERAAQIRLRWTQAVEKGNTAAAARYELAWTQAIRRVSTAQEAAAGASTLAGGTAAQAAAARGGYTRARVVGAVAGGIGALGTGVMGLGALGIGAGFELGKAGMNWQTYAAQQRANSPMTDADFRAYQRRALALAVASGARPEDILLAERYGAERGYSGGANRGVLQAGLMLGLPSGGTEALAPSEQAIITLMKNFPSLRGNAKKAAGMILAAAQNSAGTTVPEFVNAIPQTLVNAGHFGPKNASQSLAIIAALTQAGVPIDEANTMAYNIITRVAVPSPGVAKYITGLKKDKGIDLTGDFSVQGVTQKGILGVLEDVRSKNLDPFTLRKLFPYMRAFLGALGLTGNFSGSAVNINQRIQSGAGDKALNDNYKRYLGLDSTKAKELEQQFNVMSKTLGMSLLPGILQLEKELIPLGKNFSEWTRENKGTITSLIEMSPKILLVGGGLKGMSILLGSANGGLIGKVGMFSAKVLGIRGASFAAKGGLTALGSEATAAIGTAGAGAAAGTGVLGLLSAVGMLVSAFGDVKAFQFAAGNDTLGGILSILAGPAGLPLALTVGAGRYIAGKFGAKGHSDFVPMGGQMFGSGIGRQTANNTNAPKSYAFGNSYSGPLYDTDYSTGGHTGAKLSLPGGKEFGYAYLGEDYIKGMGIEIWFRCPNGGLLGFNHLETNYIAGVKKGAKVRGGTLVGLTGAPTDSRYGYGPHLCVVTDAKGREWLDLVQSGKANGNVGAGAKGTSRATAGPAGTGLNLFGSEKPYAGAFAQAGSQSHVDPSVLAGVGMIESSGKIGSGVVSSAGYGSMGVAATAGAAKNSGSPNYGTGAGGQIGGAGQQLHKWWNWLNDNPKFVAAHSAVAKRVLLGFGIKNPSKNQIMLVLALACFNAGPGSAHFDDASPGDGHGMWYAMRVLSESIAANNGHFPASYYTGQGPNRVPTNPGGVNAGGTTGGQVHYNGPSGTTTKTNPYANYTPSDWAGYWGGLASGTASSMSSFFPNVFNNNKDPRTLPKWKRAIFDKLAQRKAFDEYQSYRSTVMADPNLTQAQRQKLISEAWKHYMYRHGHPEAEYVKHNRDNNMAQIRSDFLVGREAYKPPHHHPTGHPGKKPHPLMDQQKTLVRQGDDHSQKLTKMIQLLKSIDKRLGSGGDPRQHGQTMLHSPGH